MKQRKYFRSKHVPELYSLDDYYTEIGENHCPFSSPSITSGNCLHSVYSFPQNEKNDQFLFKKLFFIILIHFEMLRKERFLRKEEKEVFLLTENIGFGNQQLRALKYEFDWIHWFLKILYTSKGWVFGKFWLGEELDNKNGISIPPPPINLFTMRSLLKPNDARFFDKTPELKSDYFKSLDDMYSYVDLKINSNLKSTKQVELLANELVNSDLFSTIIFLVDKKEEEIGKKVTLKKFKYV